MTELDGPVNTIELPHFTEAPWIHRHGDWYYLSYAYDFPGFLEVDLFLLQKVISYPG
ncbi:MAG: hypothetical protein WKI04_03605 [Ferruginibacter sp.]